MIKNVISFRDSELIATRCNKDNINNIFKKVLKGLVIDPELEQIDIGTIYNHIKIFIKNAYYSDIPDEQFEEEIYDYIGIGNNLANYKLKKLFVHNARWLNDNGYTLVSKRGKGNISYLKYIQE